MDCSCEFSYHSVLEVATYWFFIDLLSNISPYFTYQSKLYLFFENLIDILVIAKQRAITTVGCVIIVMCLSVSGISQNNLSQKVDFKITNSSLADCLWQLAEVTNVPVAYSDSDLPKGLLSFSFDNKSIAQILTEILSKANLDYNFKDNKIVVFKSESYQISGYVEDATSGERLIGASVYSIESDEGTVTNIYGFYTIKLKSTSPILKVSYIGYESASIDASVKKSSKLIIQLEPNLTIEEVVVTERSAYDSNSYDGFLSDHNLANDINKMPALGGELDYMRLLQQLPGVQSGADGLGGLYVRGGNADQNLVLLDGVSIYNPYHALGLVSIFDEQVIKKVTYHRGQFPSRYGGMISSVVDVRTKEGNNKEYQLNAGVGLVASKIKAEGPIAGGKGSFLISGRRTHLDPFLRKYSREKRAEDGQEGYYDYSFGEIMAKANYGLSPKTKVFLSFYKGNDSYENELRTSEVDGDFNFKDEEFQDLNWGNTIGSLRLNYQLSDKLFSNFTATYSKFFFQSNENRNFEFNDGTGFEQRSRFKQAYFSNITNVALKADFDYVPNTSHYVRLGLEYSQSNFQPGVLSTQDSLFFGFEELTEELQEGKGEAVSELNFYLEDEWLIHKNFGVNAGLYSSFFNSESKYYFLLDPRLSINWQAIRSLSFHMSINKVNQPLHLLTRTGSGFPNDLWVPATSIVKPQQAWIYDIETRIRLSNQWKAEAHVYYKKMNNLINYIDGADFTTSSNTLSAFNWEEKVTVGQGESKGLELLIKKDKGRYQGWVSYTISETTRQFDELNGGKIFPFRFDLRHVLSIVGSMDVSKYWSLSSSWNYRSGSNISLAYSDWQYIRQDGTPDILFFDLEDRNSLKLPAYHRLDISAKYIRSTKWGKWSMDIGVYNVYNKTNIFYVRPEYDPITEVLKYKSTSLISVLPYFSFNIEI